MSESILQRLIGGRNIALIYFFSVAAYLLYYFVLYNQDTLRESVPVFILGGIFLIAEFLFLILPAVSAIVGINQKTLRRFPAVLVILAAVLIILYILLIAGNVSLFDPVQSIPMILFFLAVPLSLLYGFSAYAIQSSSPKIKAARILGSLHAVAGVVMTICYYGMFMPAIPIGFGIWAALGLAAGILLIADRQKEESPSPILRKEKLWIAGVSIVLILILIFTGIYFVTGGFDAEYLDFREQDRVSQNASIIPLTETDYEKYPALRDIPKDIRVDKSVFAPITSVFGFIDKDTRDQILDTYGGYREENRFIARFIEHNGTVYEIGLLVF